MAKGLMRKPVVLANYVLLYGFNTVIPCVPSSHLDGIETHGHPNAVPKCFSCLHIYSTVHFRNEFTRIGMCIYPYMGYTMYNKAIR